MSARKKSAITTQIELRGVVVEAALILSDSHRGDATLSARSHTHNSPLQTCMALQHAYAHMLCACVCVNIFEFIIVDQSHCSGQALYSLVSNFDYLRLVYYVRPRIPCALVGCYCCCSFCRWHDCSWFADFSLFVFNYCSFASVYKWFVLVIWIGDFWRDYAARSFCVCVCVRLFICTLITAAFRTDAHAQLA